MTDKHDSLDLRVIHRPGDLDAHGDGKHERFSVDFMVNGRSLYETMAVEQFDLVGRFSPETREWNEQSAAVFLVTQPPDLENGRVMLYVCAECGHIGCGAITVKISEKEGTFTWSDFGYENDYDEDMTDRDSYKHVGPFIFDNVQYRRIIEKAKNTEQENRADA